MSTLRALAGPQAGSASISFVRGNQPNCMRCRQETMLTGTVIKLSPGSGSPNSRVQDMLQSSMLLQSLTPIDRKLETPIRRLIRTHQPGDEDSSPERQPEQ